MRIMPSPFHALVGCAAHRVVRNPGQVVPPEISPASRPREHHRALDATANPDWLYRTPKLQEWRFPKSND